MPQSSHHQPNHDNVPRESWRREELTNGEEVGNARNRQGNKEGRIANPAEITGTDEQRYEQNRAEPVNPVGWGELHRSPVPVRNFVTASPHSLSQTAVRGARAGARCNSAASRIRSSATSMS